MTVLILIYTYNIETFPFLHIFTRTFFSFDNGHSDFGKIISHHLPTLYLMAKSVQQCLMYLLPFKLLLLRYVYLNHSIDFNFGINVKYTYEYAFLYVCIYTSVKVHIKCMHIYVGPKIDIGYLS